MTPRQYQLLGFIESFIEANGHPPSYEEMKDAMGYKTKSNVADMVNRLIAQGKLCKSPNRKRSIAIPNKSLAAFSSIELRRELLRRANVETAL